MQLPWLKLKNVWIVLLIALISGCGDSENLVIANPGNNGNNPPVVGNTLTVNLATSAPVQARIAAGATTFEVTLYNGALHPLETQELSRGQSASFANLPDATYTIRVVGFDANGDVLGYFDRRIALVDNTSLTIAALIYTGAPPAIGSTNAPFIALTQVPDAITGGETFQVQATAFDADGAVQVGATGPAIVTASGLLLTGDNTTTFAFGVAAFPDLSLAQDAQGSVTLTVNGATSPPIPVSPGEQPLQ